MEQLTDKQILEAYNKIYTLDDDNKEFRDAWNYFYGEMYVKDRLRCFEILKKNQSKQDNKNKEDMEKGVIFR